MCESLILNLCKAHSMSLIPPVVVPSKLAFEFCYCEHI
jgi:hypothetical protein